MSERLPHLSDDESRRFSDAVDRAIELHARAGYPPLITRAIFQLLAWIVLARAVWVHDLDWLLVLVPWMVEIQLMLWLGPPLAWLVVREPVFRKNSGRWGQALVWSVLLLIPPLLVLGAQLEFDPGRMHDYLDRALRASWGNGVAIACALVAFSMLLDTAGDLRRWRVQGGAFVWPATMRQGMRFISMVVVLFVGAFVLGGLSGILESFDVRLENLIGQAAWLALVLLILSDIGELAIGALLISKSRKASG